MRRGIWPRSGGSQPPPPPAPPRPGLALNPRPGLARAQIAAGIKLVLPGSPAGGEVTPPPPPLCHCR